MTWNSILPSQTYLFTSSLSVEEIKRRLLHQLSSEYKVGPFSIFGKGRIHSFIQNDYIIIEDIIPRYKTVGKATIIVQNTQSLVSINYVAGSYFTSLFCILLFVISLLEVWLPITESLFFRNFSLTSPFIFILFTTIVFFPFVSYIHVGHSFIRKLHKKVIEVMTSENIGQFN